MADTNTETPGEYQVLARKYRPQNFDDLIGQDALVRTLKNAIESGRIAHAFMLTGIRGVGKTTTARIIAKALNYTGPDEQAGPTTGDTSDCDICRAIAEDRHPDVMEMDAASRTGVDDIREILDGVRYAPTSARYKIYIIDEVHMLSKNAFNALLKTLEEPPPHVKFIFATTEIRKVPVTVLSRCQRFDLRRIDPQVLADYYAEIAAKEQVQVDSEALKMLARAADGSVRDGLSLLDQAIALGEGEVTAQQVKDMLGLADRAMILDLLEHCLKGQAKEALDITGDLYKKGGDPAVVLQDMLQFVHLLTKHRAIPSYESDQLIAEGEMNRIEELAGRLSMPTLNRAWQVLLKGLGDVHTAPNPQAAAEMVILRLTYAADLPDPAALIKKLQKNDEEVSEAGSRSPSAAPSQQEPSTIQRDETPASAQSDMGAPTGAMPQRQPETALIDTGGIETFRDVYAALNNNGEMILASQLYMYAHPVSVKDGAIELRLAEAAPPRLSQDLSLALKAATGERWIVSVSSKEGGATLAEEDDAAEKALHADILSQPLLKEITRLFPEAKMMAVTKKKEK
jgi:DNA polymerase-3 subunit gamma/tau